MEYSFVKHPEGFKYGASHKNNLKEVIMRYLKINSVKEISSLEEWDKSSGLILESIHLKNGNIKYLYKFLNENNISKDIPVYLFNHDLPMKISDFEQVNPESCRPGYYDYCKIVYYRLLHSEFPNLKAMYQLSNVVSIHNNFFGKGTAIHLPILRRSRFGGRKFEDSRVCNKKCLFISAYYNPGKRVDVVLEAWRAIEDFELYIVGDCISEALKEEYADVLQKSNVHVEGSQDNPSKYYELCDVIVSTSASESYGYTIEEGLSYGKIVLMDSALRSMLGWSQAVPITHTKHRKEMASNLEYILHNYVNYQTVPFRNENSFMKPFHAHSFISYYMRDLFEELTERGLFQKLLFEERNINV